LPRPCTCGHEFSTTDAFHLSDCDFLASLRVSGSHSVLPPTDLSPLDALATILGIDFEVRPQWAVLEFDPSLRGGWSGHWSRAGAETWKRRRGTDDDRWCTPVAIFVRRVASWADGHELTTPWVLDDPEGPL
jgi:hypothetical protein